VTIRFSNYLTISLLATLSALGCVINMSTFCRLELELEINLMNITQFDSS
jgi:hypothetical protein